MRLPGYAMTAYYVESTECWRENLELLLRFVSTPYFTEESVEKERGIIAQEIRMYEDSADSKMYENLFSALFAHHPIRVPIAGTVESIQAITAETLTECHRAFYTPANMMLCVAGPVDPRAVADAAQRSLPDTPPTAAGVRNYGAPEALTGIAGAWRRRWRWRCRAHHRVQMQAAGSGRDALPAGTAGRPCGGASGGRILRALYKAV